MAINLFSDYGGFYNSYKTPEIPRVDTATVREQDAQKKALENAPAQIPVIPEVKAPEVPDLRTRTADLDNISLSFNTGDDYSYIGSDFAIEDLDMEKAISDMRKDKILEDYQYFVGTSSEGKPVDSSEDGIVVLKL